MSTRENEHISIWESIKTPSFESLNKNISCDVCIIGAGITGLTTAYQLLRKGVSVVVLDDKGIGCGETGRSSAHLSNVLDRRYSSIERHHGKVGARLAAESHTSAISTIESIIAREQIDCDFSKLNGYLFLDPKDTLSTLDHELGAATRAGLNVTLTEQIPKFPFQIGPSLKFPEQAQMHPVKYIAGLAKAVTKMNGRIFTRTHVTRVIDSDPPLGETKDSIVAKNVVETKNGHSVKAKHVVVATNTPINHRLILHTKQASYRTYVIALEIPHGYVPPLLLWDTAEPFHYVRVAKDRNNHDVLLVGGEDHRTGQETSTTDQFSELETWARSLFPLATNVLYRWSGQIVESMDGLGYIGKAPTSDTVYLATGDSGNGLTHGTIAGLLISDLILGQTNPWTALYDPARLNATSLVTFALENANTALQYGSWIAPGDVSSEQDISPATGAVIRRGLLKVAVYMDRNGRAHEMSAVCPHLGGVVAWNNCEKTWDCPCHGSRFDRFGKVLNGPSIENLQPIASKVLRQESQEPKGGSKVAGTGI